MSHYGIILLDDTEIIFRIYETTDHEWKLFHYYSATFLPPLDLDDILETIGDFFASDYAQHIEEWKICSRHHPKKLLTDLAKALSVPIEDMSLHREQELICKGMFTELW